MDLERIPYRATHATVQGTKNRGIPGMCWIDTVNNDTEQKGLKMSEADTKQKVVERLYSAPLLPLN